jgi:hypothetical protein
MIRVNKWNLVVSRSQQNGTPYGALPPLGACDVQAVVHRDCYEYSKGGHV